nr:MAG TPA: hypothetical protein [Bacteriophage sp.]
MSTKGSLVFTVPLGNVIEPLISAAIPDNVLVSTCH